MCVTAFFELCTLYGSVFTRVSYVVNCNSSQVFFSILQFLIVRLDEKLDSMAVAMMPA